ncbi:enoyl-CoA hydratase/isomerase family protein [Streptomyces sp. NPDC048277]|uniref:enoyl-CoA hydratase/isomerase family protein n=1 Tax=Streptomyces sp. NPDC048277 TaxID=3155027 RepID=UPI0033E11305
MEPPFTLVDLDRTAPPPVARDRVTVAVALEPRDPTAEFDVLLTAAPDPPRPWVGCADPYATAELLRSIVNRHPAACVALVQVLRMGAVLPPPDRLVLESLAYSALLAGGDFRGWLASARSRTPRPAAEPVRVDRVGERLTLTLDRPWVRNAFDATTRDALCEALEVAVADPTVTRVDLYGNGPAFCSGGDLSEFGTARDPAEAHRVRVHRSPAALLQRCAPKVTAHLHGACVGAGIELAAFAGSVTATPDTVIRLPEIGMGLIPGAGGTAGLPARIGRERTAYLALSGTPTNATQALRWGLIDTLCPRCPDLTGRSEPATGRGAVRSRPCGG